MKRGQGLSLTTIVVAAVALIVLVVLIAIFTGRIGSFEQGLSTCAYECKLGAGTGATNTTCPANYIKIGNRDVYKGFGSSNSRAATNQMVGAVFN